MSKPHEEGNLTEKEDKEEVFTTPVQIAIVVELKGKDHCENSVSRG